MRKHLQKRKNAGIIDFIEVPLDWGRCHKEFVVYDIEQDYFCRIFFDNKYRQDTENTPQKRLDFLEQEYKELEKDKSKGLYSVADEKKEVKEQMEFYKKYL